MKVRFTTLGCKLNFAESSALGKGLLSRGHQRASLSEIPDLCVVNTCSVTDAADHKDRQAINQLHRKYPNAIIVVTGCYAQLQPEQISHIEGVDYVLGQNEKYDIPALVDTLEAQLLHNPTQSHPCRGYPRGRRVSWRAFGRRPHTLFYQGAGRLQLFLYLLHHSICAWQIAQPEDRGGSTKCSRSH